MPAVPGTYTAHFKAVFNVNGLVTAADLSPDGTAAALLGYDETTGATFVWLLSDFPGTQFFRGNKRRIKLPSTALVGQVEGVCFAENRRLLVSNERVTVGPLTVPQRLYAAERGPLAAAPAVITAAAAAGPRAGLRVFPIPAAHTLHIERARVGPGALALTLLDLRGRAVATDQLPAGAPAGAINVAGLAPGAYVLRAQGAAGVVSQKIMVR